MLKFVKILRIFYLLIFLSLIFIMCHPTFADTPIIYRGRSNDDSSKGPGVFFGFNKNPKNLAPNNKQDTGPIGIIYIHQGKRYIKGKNLGEFKLTGYCACTKCSTGTGITYSGKPVTVNHTVAADLNVIPLNTMIILEGVRGKNATDYDGVYQVEDKGAGIKDKHIDIYQATHAFAMDVTFYGFNYANVYEAIFIDEKALQKELGQQKNEEQTNQP